jgi:hypothetical protein
MTQLSDRQRRLGLQLPLHVSGEDASGARFVEHVQSLNVSGGGVGFESLRPFEVGSRVSIRVEIPPPLRERFGGRSLYAARAIVCRSQHLPANDSFRVGARFLGEIED